MKLEIETWQDAAVAGKALAVWLAEILTVAGHRHEVHGENKYYIDNRKLLEALESYFSRYGR